MCHLYKNHIFYMINECWDFLNPGIISKVVRNEKIYHEDINLKKWIYKINALHHFIKTNHNCLNKSVNLSITFILQYQISLNLMIRYFFYQVNFVSNI